MDGLPSGRMYADAGEQPDDDIFGVFLKDAVVGEGDRERGRVGSVKPCFDGGGDLDTVARAINVGFEESQGETGPESRSALGNGAPATADTAENEGGFREHGTRGRLLIETVFKDGTEYLGWHSMH